ncbi:MAG TPA: response regulator [Steroidobacteraceae bacterium]|nr:response regulator [Steroidobacteraceae bacterium]
MRILVIDDESFVREALERVLKSPTISVVAAADAAAGLAALSESRFDLIIIDVVLPGMDGVAAIKQIRRDYPDARIIAISGGGNFGLSAYQPEAISTSAYLAACKAAGADGILAKPFETAELRALIGQILPD